MSYLLFLPGWPSPFDFSYQDTNSASSFNLCIFRKTLARRFLLMLFGILTLSCTVVPTSMLIYIPHLDVNILVLHQLLDILIEKYSGADKALARPGRKQATATEDFEFHISYL